jgi:Galactose oxidase-like, Early set domain/Divergent InlB B-repeat domain/Galactose oxidase, central domain
VTARITKGPFTIKISSVSPGGGSGKVKLQVGTTAKTCTITNGTLGSTTSCSISAPANSIVTLTPTAATGYAFNGWKLPTCGTAACQFKAIENLTVPATFSVITAGNPAQEGRWDPPFSTPVVAVHMHELTTGKVLLWGDTGDAQLWGAGTGFTLVPKPYRIYCTGHSFMPDGRLLVVGGTSPDTRGQRKAVVFNVASSSWSTSGSMAQGRYYPTITTLPDGSLLAVSGHDTNKTVVTIPEVTTPTGWRRLTTAPLSIPNPYYPPMFVAPNGKVFLAGFTQPSQYLDVAGTGHWTPVASRNETNRVMGSAVMYAPGKVLYVGGGKPRPFDGPPVSSAEVIDLNQASPAWRSVPGMAFARKQLNATLLADGSVLVTGGTGGPGFNDQAGAVHTAELWNPETETWTTLASEQRNRTYHSTALLLASGRVISSGSGEGGDVPYANAERSAQIFTPPYLFNPDGSLAPRPSITTAPARLAYGQSFTVETPNPAAIARGNLIRLSSVTHTFNQSQLLYPLTFTVVGSTTLSAVAPASGNLAPPGPYMLFLISTSGVPSTAKMVMVGP